MTAQVVLRFGFSRPQAWAEEVGRYLFGWTVYLGSLMALVRGSHICVTFLLGKLPSRCRSNRRPGSRGF